jgi:hypothetical protein
MKEIKLTQGKVALVDDEDYDELRRYRWSAAKKGNTYYVRRGGNSKRGIKQIIMHRIIIGAKDDDFVDHRDGNALNNQKINLRICKPQQNSWNSKPHCNSLSKYKGVTLRANASLKKRWRAGIEINGKNIHLGDYYTEEEAALAYDKAAIKRQGEFARLNVNGDEYGYLAES